MNVRLECAVCGDEAVVIHAGWSLCKRHRFIHNDMQIALERDKEERRR